MSIFHFYVIFSAIAFMVIFSPKRRIDFISIGFLSQQLYFIPLTLQAFDIDMLWGEYHYYSAVVGCYFVLCLMFFSLLKVHDGKGLVQIKPFIDLNIFSKIICIMALLGFSFSFVASGGGIFFLSKQEMMKSLGYGYILWSISTIILIPFSIYLKNKFLMAVGAISMLVIVFIGFRSPAAIAIIASIISICYANKISIYKLGMKNTLIIVIIGLLFFFYKGVYSGIKLGNYELVLLRLTDVNYYLNSLVNSEPSMTTMILSKTLEHDLRIDISHFQNIIVSMGFFGPFQPDIQSFNSIMQPEFFPGLSWGVGSNVWANIYAILGWGGLLLFITFYCLSLYFISFVLSRITGFYFLSLCPLASYWAFYIHRNDLAYQISLEKRVGMIILLAAILTFLVQKWCVNEK
ncbi:hypothetical protein HJ190_07295 [Vibrio parahaemolyticus]|uniref:hypothetical protein n=1 Tax=Vibrio parahaemolyticus TaxID=670 RepID=UPI00226B72B1|nr:hypothetical protein [Vibrio parahaemolyticus]ELB2160777.1 hypothetical protein [Vibrio parahaemolyticus]MBE3711344.1 hypothetical protein [Vibrio parahaemolyticus]MCX8890239.1 hypothetical protein [Vibrio parahaemolyticus]